MQKFISAFFILFLSIGYCAFSQVTITTNQGRKLSGYIVGEDSSHLLIRQRDGYILSVSRSGIRSQQNETSRVEMASGESRSLHISRITEDSLIARDESGVRTAIARDGVLDYYSLDQPGNSYAAGLTALSPGGLNISGQHNFGLFGVRMSAGAFPWKTFGIQSNFFLNLIDSKNFGINVSVGVGHSNYYPLLEWKSPTEVYQYMETYYGAFAGFGFYGVYAEVGMIGGYQWDRGSGIMFEIGYVYRFN